MEYRLLGRTGMKVSELCLGCMMFGAQADEEASNRILDRALEAGINFLDTADVYSHGVSEEILGRALQRIGRRDEVVLATKFHGSMNESDPNGGGNSRKHILAACEASLRRLQTDYLDLYQVHRPESQTPADETLGALDDLVRAGKVRYLGTSTYAAWQLMEALMVARERGLNRFVCEQPPYHLLDRRLEKELVPFAQTWGVGLIPWSPLAGGMLTGKYRRGEPLPADSRFGRNPDWGKRVLQDRVFDAVEAVVALAAEKSCTPAQLSLAWCKDQPAITAPIIGPRTLEQLEQLEDNLGAVEVKLSEEDHRRLDEVAPPGRALSDWYTADFGPHLYR
ncbi:MAG TPA: aldo/keto reductase [Armatimonadota bacterium]|jgi:aryl-alcohol dehydrogenase-like predicted oxidoreductase